MIAHFDESLLFFFRNWNSSMFFCLVTTNLAYTIINTNQIIEKKKHEKCFYLIFRQAVLFIGQN